MFGNLCILEGRVIVFKETENKLRYIVDCRDREEAMERLKALGIEMSENELEKIRQRLNIDSCHSSCLSMEQLDKVAGGMKKMKSLDQNGHNPDFEKFLIDNLNKLLNKEPLDNFSDKCGDSVVDFELNGMRDYTFFSILAENIVDIHADRRDPSALAIKEFIDRVLSSPCDSEILHLHRDIEPIAYELYCLKCVVKDCKPEHIDGLIKRFEQVCKTYKIDPSFSTEFKRLSIELGKMKNTEKTSTQVSVGSSKGEIHLGKQGDSAMGQMRKVPLVPNEHCPNSTAKHTSLMDDRSFFPVYPNAQRTGFNADKQKTEVRPKGISSFEDLDISKTASGKVVAGISKNTSDGVDDKGSHPEKTNDLATKSYGTTNVPTSLQVRNPKATPPHPFGDRSSHSDRRPDRRPDRVPDRVPGRRPDRNSQPKPETPLQPVLKMSKTANDSQPFKPDAHSSDSDSGRGLGRNPDRSSQQQSLKATGGSSQQQSLAPTGGESKWQLSPTRFPYLSRLFDTCKNDKDFSKFDEEIESLLRPLLPSDYSVPFDEMKDIFGNFTSQFETFGYLYNHVKELADLYLYKYFSGKFNAEETLLQDRLSRFKEKEAPIVSVPYKDLFEQSIDDPHIIPQGKFSTLPFSLLNPLPRNIFNMIIGDPSTNATPGLTSFWDACKLFLSSEIKFVVFVPTPGSNFDKNTRKVDGIPTILREACTANGIDPNSEAFFHMLHNDEFKMNSTPSSDSFSISPEKTKAYPRKFGDLNVSCVSSIYGKDNDAVSRTDNFYQKLSNTAKVYKKQGIQVVLIDICELVRSLNIGILTAVVQAAHENPDMSFVVTVNSSKGKDFVKFFDTKSTTRLVSEEAFESYNCGDALEIEDLAQKRFINFDEFFSEEPSSLFVNPNHPTNICYVNTNNGNLRAPSIDLYDLYALYCSLYFEPIYVTGSFGSIRFNCTSGEIKSNDIVGKFNTSLFEAFQIDPNSKDFLDKFRRIDGIKEVHFGNDTRILGMNTGTPYLMEIDNASVAFIRFNEKADLYEKELYKSLRHVSETATEKEISIVNIPFLLGGNPGRPFTTLFDVVKTIATEYPLIKYVFLAHDEESNSHLRKEEITCLVTEDSIERWDKAGGDLHNTATEFVSKDKNSQPNLEAKDKNSQQSSEALLSPEEIQELVDIRRNGHASKFRQAFSKVANEKICVPSDCSNPFEEYRVRLYALVSQLRECAPDLESTFNSYARVLEVEFFHTIFNVEDANMSRELSKKSDSNPKVFVLFDKSFSDPPVDKTNKSSSEPPVGNPAEICLGRNLWLTPTDLRNPLPENFLYINTNDKSNQPNTPIDRLISLLRTSHSVGFVSPTGNPYIVPDTGDIYDFGKFSDSLFRALGVEPKGLDFFNKFAEGIKQKKGTHRDNKGNKIECLSLPLTTNSAYLRKIDDFFISFIVPPFSFSKNEGRQDSAFFAENTYKVLSVAVSSLREKGITTVCIPHFGGTLGYSVIVFLTALVQFVRENPDMKFIFLSYDKETTNVVNELGVPCLITEESIERWRSAKGDLHNTALDEALTKVLAEAKSRNSQQPSLKATATGRSSQQSSLKATATGISSQQPSSKATGRSSQQLTGREPDRNSQPKPETPSSLRPVPNTSELGIVHGGDEIKTTHRFINFNEFFSEKPSSLFMNPNQPDNVSFIDTNRENPSSANTDLAEVNTLVSRLNIGSTYVVPLCGNTLLLNTSINKMLCGGTFDRELFEALRIGLNEEFLRIFVGNDFEMSSNDKFILCKGIQPGIPYPRKFGNISVTFFHFATTTAPKKSFFDDSLSRISKTAIEQKKQVIIFPFNNRALSSNIISFDEVKDIALKNPNLRYVFLARDYNSYSRLSEKKIPCLVMEEQFKTLRNSPEEDLHKKVLPTPGGNLQPRPTKASAAHSDRALQPNPAEVQAEDKALHHTSSTETVALGPAVDPDYFQSEIDRLKDTLPENENPNRFVNIYDFRDSHLKNNRYNGDSQVPSDSTIWLAPEALIKNPLPPNLYVANTNKKNSKLPYTPTELFPSLFGNNAGFVLPIGNLALNKTTNELEYLGVFSSTLLRSIGFSITGERSFNLLAGELPREDGEIQKYLSDKKDVRVYPCTQVKNLHVNKSYPRELNGVSVAFVSAFNPKTSDKAPEHSFAKHFSAALSHAKSYFEEKGKFILVVPWVGGGTGRQFFSSLVPVVQLALQNPHIKVVFLAYDPKSIDFFARKGCQCLVTDDYIR